MSETPDAYEVRCTVEGVERFCHRCGSWHIPFACNGPLEPRPVSEWVALAKRELRPSRAIDRTADRAKAEARATDDVLLPREDET